MTRLTYRGFHFTTAEGRLRYGDGRLVEVGKVLTSPAPVELCRGGMHASANVIHALRNAPGTRLWRVELTGDVVTDEDKAAGRHRKAIKNLGDQRDNIVKFAQWCAGGARVQSVAAAREAWRAASQAAAAMRAWAEAGVAQEAARRAAEAAWDTEQAWKVKAGTTAEVWWSAEWTTTAAEELLAQENWWRRTLGMKKIKRLSR